MKKLITIIISLIIIVLSFSFIVSSKEDFSENENRYLTKYPKLTLNNIKTGKYTSELSKYLSDHFVIRERFMNIKTKVDELLGKKKINDVYIGRDGYLLMEYPKSSNIDKNISVLNNFYHNLNYLNVELMLVPTSIEINKDKLPKYVVTNEFDDYEKYNKGIKFNKINVYNTLEEHNKNYQMYYKLDHHWTTYGAYYAYVEYCKSNNIKPYPINDFDIEEVTSSFKGTLYSKVLDNKLESDSIYQFKYDGDYKVDSEKELYDFSALDKKDKYEFFLGGNYPLITITNSKVKNNKELLIIKDSYANSIIPFLANHFSKIHVIDPRYYNDSITNYVKNSKITDILFLYNMDTIDKDTGIKGIR